MTRARHREHPRRTHGAHRGHVLLLALFLVVSSSRAEAQTPARGARLAATVRDYARRHEFSGTVLVQHKGKTIHRQSFGLADRAFGVPITDETRFWVASITKAFTAVLILQLHEQGKLDLRATIRTYLPEYTGEGAARVTIHHLLTHTSGIRNLDTVRSYEEAVANGLEVYQLPHTSDQLLAKYASGPLVRQAGSAFDYNNADYIILGKIVERLTGQTFEQALRERILVPQRMLSTGMLRHEDVVARLARTYWKPGEKQPLINDLPVYPQNWYAAGGMYSTTRDVLAFSAALFGGKLLAPESMKLMLTPGLDDYGYGLWVASPEINGRPRRIAHRPGSIMGANSVLLRFLDDDLTVVILANSNATDLDAFAFTIGRAVLR